ncbi:aminodeoxychorismate/anthranilate synthase component II [Psychrobium sp. nBUS_13]|uniref:aminodeoxychorismate/anthranilate synthase component II n=1 Tax=Psychrobium sp. nBUS_13 TaxID=3395319 RepID=UPI003EC02BC4
MLSLEQCHVFLLDNFDSFTYNLVDQFRVMGVKVTVYRNDIDADFIIEQMNHSELSPVLVLSPGPGTPSDAGCLVELVNKCRNNIPMLGICLGHQAIVQSFGGVIGLAPQTVHGKSSEIAHNDQGPFKGLINPMPVARYHSLMATTMPAGLNVLATTNDIVMSVMDDSHTIIGFQFHPESILTLGGEALLVQSLTHLINSKEHV